jgi:glutamate dehydrogenase
MAVEARGGETSRSMIAERLRDLITRRAARGNELHLVVFARLLLGRSEGYVDRLAEEEAMGLVTSAYRFYAGPGPELRVRAITPNYAADGWDAAVSVIETAISDRPFVVDTIRATLDAAGIEIRALLHPIFAATRDATGGLATLAAPGEQERRESFVHVAISRSDAGQLARLAEQVQARLEDLRLVTDDFPQMVARAHAVATELDGLGRLRPGPVAVEATGVADFLRWLVDGGFVFLGYREYGLTAQGDTSLLALRQGTGLGLLRRESRSAFAQQRHVDALSEPVKARLFGSRLLTVAKTVATSPVHRHARMDDIGVKEFDAEGRVVGERRFIGLFTSKASAEEAAELPILRRMLRQILTAEQVVPGSHDYKELVAVFNALPKSELLASTPPEIRADLRQILAAVRGDDVVVSVRGQPGNGRLAVLVVLPPGRFSSEARQQIGALLQERLGGTLLDDSLSFVDGDRALLHFTLTGGALAAMPSTAELRDAVAAMVRSWDERLREVLVAQHGESEGARLWARYAGALPDDYKAAVPVERAAADVALLASVAREGRLRVVLENPPLDRAEPPTTAFRAYLGGQPLVLSEVMPILENLGLRVVAEDRVSVTPEGGPSLFIETFLVQDRQERRLDVGAVAGRLTEAILALQARQVTNDRLNRLILEAGLDWRAVDCLRAYAGYAAQVGLAPRPAIIDALADNPDPARLLFECFAARFRPERAGTDAAACRVRFLQSVEAVPTLRMDLLFRALLDVVEATVRTTFYTRGERGYLAFKIRSADLAALPVPRPLYEIYVLSPTMEGIHLRAGKVARGGIRYSDRPEDLRREILGLMKTQAVKNAVIVPTGAKGGFVVKGLPARAAVVEAYRTFIRGMLDLTDNLVEGRVVHPRGLVIHDEEDPYLVVAADKGTATFSDVANGIAAEYGFWLGDAFASGGSHGYDHKGLGITARGAWECVRTHFRELGIDADTAPLSVAGIGDMSGDVFGNGLLRSRHLRLLGAFNHLHVFVDPDPDPARSFAERDRLFRAGKGWDAYDPSVLSPGAAIVPRAAKRVPISPEVQALLGLPPEPVSGERLVQAVLTLDADLLWNGGIGTYVAATGESDAEIADPQNDAVRVKASALRARAIAEGGNLGVTQRGRVEYAVNGGRINTDAVDNSAGVDLSDHEVNLKICLQPLVERGTLGPAERNALLAAVTDDVVARVLDHNRRQSRVLGLDQTRTRTRLEDFRELIAHLERAAGLDRAFEGLPERDHLRARRGTFLGLARPELAVLMGYTKIALQRELLASTLPDDPLVESYLLGYFPSLVTERSPEAVARHPLRREIVSTELANTLVDHLGTTFVHRVTRDTGAAGAEALRAWTIAWTLLGGAELTRGITASVQGGELETRVFLLLERAAERLTKWVLANADTTRSAAAVAAELGDAIGRVRPRLATWVAGAEAEAFQKLVSELEIAGLPASLARDLTDAEWLTGALDVVTAARDFGVDLEATGKQYYALEEHLGFAWLEDRLAEVSAEDRWHRRAVEGLAADLRAARRRLTGWCLRATGTLPERPLRTVQDAIRDLRTAPRTTLAALQVVVREIRRLAEDTA